MTLAPLRWQLHEDAWVGSNGVIHTTRCKLDVAEIQTGAVNYTMVKAATVLELQRAPRLCGRCRPDVEMRLSKPATSPVKAHPATPRGLRPT